MQGGGEALGPGEPQPQGFVLAWDFRLRGLGRASVDPRGRALGFALEAPQAIPTLERLILPTACGSIVVFELIDSAGSRFALAAAREAT
jgi:hypothetical protein